MYRALRKDGTVSYERLKADYDAAFDRLREEAWRLRVVTQQASTDRTAKQAAQQRVDQALTMYRECRNKLADYLVSLRPTARLWRPAPVAEQRTTTSSRQEVQALAYRLWEEAGRPIGNPDAHWYRAEELLANSIGGQT